jgi:hypothetical protein
MFTGTDRFHPRSRVGTVIDTSRLTETEKDMDDLVAHVLDVHGGLDRWSGIGALTARTSIGGRFWSAKGWPEPVLEETVEIDPHRQHAVLTPFTAPDRAFTLDVDPERVDIRAADGRVVQERTEPRASFAGLGLTSPWDALQTGYFFGYAIWNYLTTPFLFTCPGVRSREIEPWQEGGQTWRRLHVTFPDSIATHGREQVFHYDTDGLLRRHDYEVDINGGVAIAHYTDDHTTFDGFVFPTRRAVRRRNPDGTANLDGNPSITIDIHHVTTA